MYAFVIVVVVIRVVLSFIGVVSGGSGFPFRAVDRAAAAAAAVGDAGDDDRDGGDGNGEVVEVLACSLLVVLLVLFLLFVFFVDTSALAFAVVVPRWCSVLLSWSLVVVVLRLLLTSRCTTVC